jgi:predicted acylesterase/phospholipase RssA
MPSPRYRSFKQHLDPAVTPKRLLALDGGGLRGVLTLGMLREVEAVLRARFGGDPDFRLCDYFDLIGGTSTGAIIAACLALGMSVDEVHGHYLALGDAVLKRSILRFGVVRSKYDGAKVARALKSVYGDRTLASPDYRTGLLVMSKRLDTGSPWPLTNNPKAKYFGVRPNTRVVPNGEFPLWRVVRASTAAPHFFEPEFIEITKADRERGMAAVNGEFVDGGVSTGNNPALQMLMTATMEGFKFGWSTGADNMLVVSLGTGKANPALGLSSGIKATAGIHAMRALASLMDDCSDLVETVMQWMSSSATAREIDRETLLATPALGGTATLSYQRYNVLLDPDWCAKVLKQDWAAKDLAALEAMDEPDNIEALDALGRAAGAVLVKPEHFPAAFDAGVAA